jgi:Suppressor of fused protein (SUFU)
MTMPLADYIAAFKDKDISPGWQAIDDACARVYGPGDPLGHFAPSLPPMLGGDGPDGISVYRNGDHFHYVSYGFTTLHYDEDAAGGEFSGYGFELTFRLKAPDAARDDLPMWPITVMQNLYRYVRESGRWFEAGHCVPSTNSPINADLSFDDSVISGILFAIDPQLCTIPSPHGDVQFLQMIGITVSEAEAHLAGTLDLGDLIADLTRRNRLLVTDMTRR